jgi:putative transposase
MPRLNCSERKAKTVRKDHMLGVRRQCALMTLALSKLYYQIKTEKAQNLRFLKIIDKQFLETWRYWPHRTVRYVLRNSQKYSRHCVRHLMRLMRLDLIYQQSNCPIPDDHIDPRRSELFIARLMLEGIFRR